MKQRTLRLRMQRGPANPPRPVFEVLIRAAQQFGVSVEEMRGGQSFKPIVEARITATAALYGLGYGLSTIGYYLHKDHSTINYYLKRRAARLAPLKPPARELGELAADEWSCMS